MKKHLQRFIAEMAHAHQGEMLFGQRLHFLPGVLDVTANSKDAIAAVQKRFAYYQTVSMPIVAPRVQGDIILVRESDFPSAGWEGNAYRGDVFWHDQAGRREFLWKENHMLVEFSAVTGARIVIVVNQPSREMKPAPRTREAGKVPVKGGADFVNWEEIADLLFLIFARIRGKICLHAACLSYDGQGILIAGPSGSGKTTAALSLLRGGFEYHSDEIAVIPGRINGSYLVSGLLVSPRIRAKIAHLDDLERSIDPAFSSASTAHALPAPAIAAGKDKAVKPAAVFVIDPVQNRKSRHHIEALDEQSALVVLLGQVLDPTIHTRQNQVLDSLCELMRLSRIFKLEVGTDIAALPAFVKKHAFGNWPGE